MSTQSKDQQKQDKKKQESHTVTSLYKVWLSGSKQTSGQSDKAKKKDKKK